VINHHFSYIRTPDSGLEIIGAGFWYQTNVVPDLHDTYTGNRRREMEKIFSACFWSVRVSWVQGIDIKLHTVIPKLYNGFNKT